MKILLVHNRYQLVGGAEVFYREVGRVLEENGHDVAYFSRYDKENDTKWSNYFPNVSDKNNGSLLRRIVKFPNMVYNFEAKKNMKKIIEDFKPDIVHIFAIYTGLTPSILTECKKANIPVVMSANDYKLICPNYKLYHHSQICEDCKDGAYYKAIQNKCCKDSLAVSVASTAEAYVHKWLDSYRKNIDLFLFASEFMAKKTEEFWGAKTFSWDILKNPFESKKYALSKEYDDYCIYFGRIIDEKGVDVLINAMKYCLECKVKIVGDGPDEKILQDLVSKLKLDNVEFVGAKWGEELDEILSKARFVVVPSVWHENFPYVILQSFALGKAVIGSNRGGIPELIKDGEYGYVYDAPNAKELGEKIRLLWESPKETVIMGEKAKLYVATNFNDEKFYENIMRIYNKVLS